MDASLRAELIAFCGIETEFNDAWGKPGHVSEQHQLQLLAAQGFDINDDDNARRQLLQRQLEYWQQLLPAVSVQDAAQPQHLLLQVPLAQANTSLALTLISEDGTARQFNLIPVDGELVQVVQLDEVEYHQYQHPLPVHLAAGYHQLQLADGSWSFDHQRSPKCNKKCDHTGHLSDARIAATACRTCRLSCPVSASCTTCARIAPTSACATSSA